MLRSINARRSPHRLREPRDNWGTVGTVPVYDGTFDNSYYNSANPASPTGVIWVCGAPAALLRCGQCRLRIMSMGTGNLYGPVTSSTTTSCSPVNRGLY